MNVLPVLDILRGQVVRGIAGHRENYQLLASQLTSSNAPRVVARAIRDAFHLNQLYLADLDAILHQKPNMDLYRQLIEDGFQLLIDAGIRDRDDASAIRKCGQGIGIVVGLETCRSPQALAQIAEGSNDVIFSLDLQNGQPRRAADAVGWSDQPAEIVRQVVQYNVTTILVLDLSDVGMGTGGSTDSICRFIQAEFPTIRIIAGGGVRGREDLRRLNALGIDGVLVASALHDGRLGHADVHSR